MDKVIKELRKIQKEMSVPKSQFNKFGNYYFRNCEDIMEAVKPYLDTCIVIVSDEIDQQGDRYYVKATATITDGINSIHAYGYAREGEDKKGMDVAQITGASSSYARKYALNGLLAIDDSRDPDNGSNTQSETKNTAQGNTEAKTGIKSYISTVPGAAKSKQYFALASEVGYDGDTAKDAVKKQFKLSSYTEVEAKQLDAMINAMKKRKEKMNEQPVDIDSLVDELQEEGIM